MRIIANMTRQSAVLVKQYALSKNEGNVLRSAMLKVVAGWEALNGETLA